jgi:biopolymer transport protein ExbD
LRRGTRAVGKRSRRAVREVADLDITSLLDILVIMLVFLLKSYNSSGLVINIPKSVSIPHSVSTSINNPGVVVQVSPTMIWVDDKVILDSENLPPNAYDGFRKRRIVPLYNELINRKMTIQQVEKASDQAKKFSGIINLVIDKSLKYSYIKKILYTSAEAGFMRYKFVVMGEE